MKIGTIDSGFRFQGGDPGKDESWVKVPAIGTVDNGYEFTGGDPGEDAAWKAIRNTDVTAGQVLGSTYANIDRGVLKIIGGLGTIAQAPLAYARSAVTGGVQTLDRGVTDLENWFVPGSSQYSEPIQAEARRAAQDAMAQRKSNVDADNGSWWNPRTAISRVGLGLQERAREDVNKNQAWEAVNAPGVVAQSQNISDASGVWGTTKAIAQNPWGFSANLAESLPMMALGLGTGKALAMNTMAKAQAVAEAAGLKAAQIAGEAAAHRAALAGANFAESQAIGRAVGAQAIGPAMEASIKASQALAIGRASVAGTANEAITAGMSARDDTYNQVKSMSLAALDAGSARYRELVAQNGDPQRAREVLANELADQTPALVGAGTALGSMLTNKLFGGDTTAKAVANFERTTAKDVGKNFLQEGTEEVLQGIPEELNRYSAMAQADPNTKLDLGGSAVQNFAGGAALGGVGVGSKYGWEHARAAMPGKLAAPAPAAPAGTAPAGEAPPVNPPPAGPAPADQAPPTPPAPLAPIGQTSAAATSPSAAESALLTPINPGAIDRVQEIDAQTSRLDERLAELNRPDAGYGPMFDSERQDLTAQRAALTTERAGLTKTWPAVVPGAATSFSTESGARLDATYGLVEASSLTASHDEGLRSNPAYPAELQPRDRDRAASEMQVSGIVQKLDPARLGVSADAGTGAPIIGPDGLVESGNARTIALQRIYRADGQKAADYRAFLTQHAAAFGLTPESVAGMKQPVLVRVRSTPVNRVEFARQANASTVAQMSPAEQAKSDAARIDSMEDLQPDDNGDFSGPASRPFVRRFMARLPQTEQAGMIDAAGNLSSAGYTRVRNAVLARAYGDSGVLARMTESMDDNLRNVSRALVTVAPAVAAMRESVAAGNRHAADITPDLMAAVEELSRLKDAGVGLKDALAQTDMLGEKYSPETRELLTFLADNMRRPRRMADFVLAYAQALNEAGDPKQSGLFGETVPPTKSELMGAARRSITDGNSLDQNTERAIAEGNPAPAGPDRSEPANAQSDRGSDQGDGAASTADTGTFQSSPGSQGGGSSTEVGAALTAAREVSPASRAMALDGINHWKNKLKKLASDEREGHLAESYLRPYYEAQLARDQRMLAGEEGGPFPVRPTFNEVTPQTLATPANRDGIPAGRTYLAVPFQSKNYVKTAGAKWDADKKLWFADPIASGLAAGEININLRQFIPTDYSDSPEYNFYSKDVAAAVAANAELRTGVPHEARAVKLPDSGRTSWSVVPEEAQAPADLPEGVTAATDGVETLQSRSTGGGMPLAELQAVSDRIKSRMPNMPPVNVLASPADAPATLQTHIMEQGAWDDVEGAMHDGQLYLFASGLKDAMRAEHVLAAHEAAHYGLRAVLGDSLKPVMQSIFNNNADIRRAAEEKQKRGKLTVTEAVEEVIVDIPSRELVKLRGWRRVTLAARDALAAAGYEGLAAKLNGWLDGRLSEQQRADLFVADLVQSARSYMGGKPGGAALDIRLSRNPDEQAARAALGRIMAADGVTSPDDLRDLLRVPGYSQWAQSTLAGNVDATTKLRAELDARFPGYDWKAPSLTAQGAISVYADFAKDNLQNEKLTALAELADQYGAPITVRGNFGADATRLTATELRLRDAGFVMYTGSQEMLNGARRRALISYIRPGGGIGRNTPMFSRAPVAAPVAERAEAIIQDQVATRKPFDYLARQVTRLTGIERLTGTIYKQAGFLLDRYTPEQIKAGIISDYGVPQAVIDQRTLLSGRQRVQLRQAGVLIDKLSNLTRAESRVAYAWMNETDPTEADQLMADLPADSVKVLRDVEKMIDRLSREAVALGQLSPEAYERHRFAYLRRSYAKYVIEQTGGEKVARAKTIAILGDQYKGRGIEESATMAQMQAAAPEWWKRKLQVGKADVALKGEKFIRLERHAPSGEGTAPLAGIGDRSRGKLREVAYYPAGEPLPANYAMDWTPAGTFEVRGTQGDKVVLWRDFTKAEREVMGEIDEARFAIAKTLHGMIHDVEVGRYLEWLAHKYALKEGQEIPGELVPASERMKDAFAPGTWVRVPDSKIQGTSVAKYGKLAGRYLPGPIWNDLRQTINGQFRPLGDTYGKILSLWKTSKTALSPTVHMNNVMANFVMADWHDISATHISKALRIMLAGRQTGKGLLGAVGNKLAAVGGIQDVEAAAEILNRYRDSGGDIGSWANNEIMSTQLAPLLESLEAELAATGGNSVQAEVGVMSALQHALMLRFPSAWDAAKGSVQGKAIATEGRTIIDLYQSEDEVFRLASWLKIKEEGGTDQEAGKAARRSFLDYQINAPWVQAARNSALPFVSFTYRAVPMLLETMGKKPHKLLKLMALAGALNMLGVMIAGGDDDKDRKLLPEEKAGRIWGLVPKLIRMPWNDANGSPVYLDIRRFIPIGDVVDVGQGHSAIPVLPGLQPGGPLMVLAELLLNRTAFTGKPVTLDTDTSAQQVGKVLDHLYKAMMPNVVFVPGTYAWSAVSDAVKGRTDAFGREQSVTQALLSSVGIKLGSYPADVMRRNLIGKSQAELMEIDKNINQLKRQLQTHRIDAEEFQKAVQVEQDKKRKVQSELAEKMN